MKTRKKDTHALNACSPHNGRFYGPELHLDLGKMFRGMEVAFYRLFDLPDFELYGKAIDGVASAGGTFVPGIGWPIVGMVIGGFLVSRMEKENRGWAHYPKKLLVLSFIVFNPVPWRLSLTEFWLPIPEDC